MTSILPTCTRSANTFGSVWLKNLLAASSATYPRHDDRLLADGTRVVIRPNSDLVKHGSHRQDAADIAVTEGWQMFLVYSSKTRRTSS